MGSPRYGSLPPGFADSLPPGFDEPKGGDGRGVESSNLGQMKLAVFFAAWVVSMAALFSVFSQKPFQIMRIVSSIFLFVTATVVAIADIPLNFSRLATAKNIVSKFFRITARITGRGIILVFLGSDLFGLLYDNDVHPYLAVTVVVPVTVLGLFLMIYGFIKSSKVDAIRQEMRIMRANEGASIQEHMASFATLPDGGLTPSDLRSLTYSLGKVLIDYEELILLFGALNCEAPACDRDFVTVKQLYEWLGDGCMLLL